MDELPFFAALLIDERNPCSDAHTGSLPPTGGICLPSEQRSAFVVSDEDGQLVQGASVKAAEGTGEQSTASTKVIFLTGD